MSTPRSSALDDRYGTSGPVRRKGVVALAVVVVAAGLSWLAWAMLEQGRPEVQSALVGFEAEGSHAAVATFDVVRRSAEVEASCLLRAFSADHAVVGEANVTVGPGGQERQRLRETVRTERQATSVEMVGCVTQEQRRRR
jgi:hypothetical protein